MKDFVCVDLETTGLNPKKDRITEIGALKVKNGQIVSEFHSLVNPGRKLDERIVELTGIRDEDLMDAPDISAVLPGFIEFSEELPLLGHSILFDYSFLKKAAVDRKLTFERSGVDTLAIARKYLCSLESRGLGFLCRYYGIPIDAHRALSDARATVGLFEKLCEQFEVDRTTGETDPMFLPKRLLFQVKRDTPSTIPQRERLYRLCEQHKITLEAAPEEMTRSEADRLLNQLRQQGYVLG